jgi:hypothetical protein
MSRTKLLIATVCLATAFTVGCSKETATASDAQITNEIQAKLYADSTTKGSNVGVTVKDGAVTLTGDVPNSDVELAAMKIANSAGGVRTVADQLKVAGVAAANTAPVPAAPAAEAPKQLASSKPAPARTEPAPPPVNNPAPASTSPMPDTAAATAPAASPEPAPVARPTAPARVTIPAGDRLSIRTTETIDSGKVSEGQTFRASLEAPLTSQGQVIVPAGAPVTLQISSVKSAGRIKGNSELSLRATSIEYRNRNYPITTSEYADAGKARGKNTALKTGIGAGVGALIGGLAGGGKGAAIGAGAGGGAGFGYNALTHGQQIKIPAETVLNLRLESSLTVPAPRNQQ